MAKSFVSCFIEYKLSRMSQGEYSSRRNAGIFQKMSLRNTKCWKFPKKICVKDNSRKFTFLDQ
jgi:hypothetical protein